MSGLAIECRGVVFERRRPDGVVRRVLDGIEAVFPPGRVAAIEGPTGAGKSTLLSLLALLARPAAGEVRVEAEAASRLLAPHRDALRQRFGLLFQSPRLFGDLTALENIVAPLIPRGLSLPESLKLAREALREAGIESLAARSAAELSGGERQRVALARASAGDPEALLLDEPTAYQDVEGVRIVSEIVSRARNRGATVVLATHDPRAVESCAPDDVYFLASGRLKRR
ncbi:MAG: ATP-binding cassette domain-containing protein [Myxococcales bacterium]|nr:MAG: ATP-binding cassette domain-containing protein [Myxococcales bacterium]